MWDVSTLVRFKKPRQQSVKWSFPAVLQHILAFPVALENTLIASHYGDSLSVHNFLFSDLQDIWKFSHPPLLNTFRTTLHQYLLHTHLVHGCINGGSLFMHNRNKMARRTFFGQSRSCNSRTRQTRAIWLQFCKGAREKDPNLTKKSAVIWIRKYLTHINVGICLGHHCLRTCIFALHSCTTLL